MPKGDIVLTRDRAERLLAIVKAAYMRQSRENEIEPAEWKDKVLAALGEDHAYLVKQLSAAEEKPDPNFAWQTDPATFEKPCEHEWFNLNDASFKPEFMCKKCKVVKP